LDQKYTLVAKGIGFSHIVSMVSELTSIPPKDLAGPCKERKIVKARVQVCYWSVTDTFVSKNNRFLIIKWVDGRIGVKPQLVGNICSIVIATKEKDQRWHVGSYTQKRYWQVNWKNLDSQPLSWPE
jgi:hypothetical protein